MRTQCDMQMTAEDVSNELEKLDVKTWSFVRYSQNGDGDLWLRLGNVLSDAFSHVYARHSLQSISKHMHNKCRAFTLASACIDGSWALLRFAFFAASMSRDAMLEEAVHLARALNEMVVDLDLEDAV